MNKSPQFNQQAQPDQCKPEVQEMYSSDSGNCLSISVNAGAILENSSEETIYESSQIKELHGTIKLVNKKVMINDDASTKAFIYKPR